MNTIAFVVGVNDYEHFNKLPSAKNDAEAMAKLFDSLEYKVYSAIDETYDETNRIFNSYIEDLFCYDYEAAIFYFAGHGTQIMLDDCLILKDTPAERGYSGKSLKDKSLVLHDIVNDIRAAQGNHVCICILDCCRDGRGLGANTDVSLKDIPYQTFFAYATTAGDKASTHVASNHGYFTESILSKFNEHDELEVIFKRVRADVYGGCGKLSWVHTSLINNVYLNRGKESKYLCKPYSHDAYHDSEYQASSEELAKAISEMKVINYDHQRDAIQAFIANIAKATDDDKFVYGRNLLQSFDGGCIDSGIELKNIHKYSEESNNHVLNGALYEMYFDKNDTLRTKIKGLGVASILAKFILNDDFAESKKFIKNALDEKDANFRFRIDNPQKVSVILNLKDSYETNDIGEKIFYVLSILVEECNVMDDVFKGRTTINKAVLKDYLQQILQIPKDFINFGGTRCDETSVLIIEE